MAVVEHVGRGALAVDLRQACIKVDGLAGAIEILAQSGRQVGSSCRAPASAALRRADIAPAQAGREGRRRSARPAVGGEGGGEARPGIAVGRIEGCLLGGRDLGEEAAGTLRVAAGEKRLRRGESAGRGDLLWGLRALRPLGMLAALPARRTLRLRRRQKERRRELPNAMRGRRRR